MLLAITIIASDTFRSRQFIELIDIDCVSSKSNDAVQLIWWARPFYGRNDQLRPPNNVQGSNWSINIGMTGLLLSPHWFTCLYSLGCSENELTLLPIYAYWICSCACHIKIRTRPVAKRCHTSRVVRKTICDGEMAASRCFCGKGATGWVVYSDTAIQVTLSDETALLRRRLSMVNCSNTYWPTSMWEWEVRRDGLS